MRNLRQALELYGPSENTGLFAKALRLILGFGL
jgi:hypothetical protein